MFCYSGWYDVWGMCVILYKDLLQHLLLTITLNRKNVNGRLVYMQPFLFTLAILQYHVDFPCCQFLPPVLLSLSFASVLKVSVYHVLMLSYYISHIFAFITIENHEQKLNKESVCGTAICLFAVRWLDDHSYVLNCHCLGMQTMEAWRCQLKQYVYFTVLFLF